MDLLRRVWLRADSAPECPRHAPGENADVNSRQCESRRVRRRVRLDLAEGREERVGEKARLRKLPFDERQERARPASRGARVAQRRYARGPLAEGIADAASEGFQEDFFKGVRKQPLNGLGREKKRRRISLLFIQRNLRIQF